MSDSKYFAATKRGELPELKQGLHSNNKKEQLASMKRIVANMALGNDLSALFPDVLQCMRSEMLEMKKMVYLYIVTYAKARSELALLTVNSFVMDASKNPNPLIRALALRNMSYIPVDKINESLAQCLRQAVKDEDAYVRRTAAMCIAKLHEHEPDMVRNEGFFEILQEMIADKNPNVVANVLAVIADINLRSSESLAIHFAYNIVRELLTVLNECTAWAQTYILESLATHYNPVNGAGEFNDGITVADVDALAALSSPRLSHASPSVVMSCIRFLMRLYDHLSSTEQRNALSKKISAATVAIMAFPLPEVRYVALRNTSLLIQKCPNMFDGDIKVFFCDYNDPIYVKMAKIEIIIRLVNPDNCKQVLSELKEYATEVDADFARKAVRAIGICAVKIDAAIDLCLKVLHDLMATPVEHLIEESIVVVRDILRRYPDQTSVASIVPGLFEHDLPGLAPQAKAALTWLLGNYFDLIPQAAAALDSRVDNILDEQTPVQLATLTACVTVFLKRPAGAEPRMKRLLQMVTDYSPNPDLRDRAYMYWRLLSSNPAAARLLISSTDKPICARNPIDGGLGPVLLRELLFNLGTLASVYHKPPSSFLSSTKARAHMPPPLPSDAGSAAAAAATAASHQTAAAQPAAQPAAAAAAQPAGPASYLADGDAPYGSNFMNLLDLDDPAPAPGGAPVDNRNSMYGGYAMTGGSPSMYVGASVTGSGGASDLDTLFGGISLIDNSLDTPTTPSPMGAPTPGGGLFSADIAALGAGGTFVDPFSLELRAPLVKQSLLQASAGRGLDISGGFVRRGTQPTLELTITNRAMQPIGEFFVQFNTNGLGAQPAKQVDAQKIAMPNMTLEVSIPLSTSASAVAMKDPFNNLQVALKSTVGVVYFQSLAPLHVFFKEAPQAVLTDNFLAKWNALPADNPALEQLSIPLPEHQMATFKQRLQANNVYTVAERQIGTEGALVNVYFSFAVLEPTDTQILFEIRLPTSGNVAATVVARSSAGHVIQAAASTLAALIRTHFSESAAGGASSHGAFPGSFF